MIYQPKTKNFVMDNLEDLNYFRLHILENIEADKLRIEGQN